ncbi:MAG: LolA-related protein [bacterium]
MSIGIAVIGCESALAQTILDAKTLMQILAQVKEAQLTFVERRTSAFLVDEIKLTGRMVYEAPDKIEKFVETPFVENIKIQGDKILIEKISNRGDASYQSYSLSSLEVLNTTVEGIRATLSGNFAALVDSYEVELSGDMSDWSVLLTPKKPEVLEVIEKIAVSGSDSKIKVIETFDADGDESRLDLSYQMIR